MTAIAPFSEAAHVTPTSDGDFVADIPTGWGQGRTAFGGLGAAILVNAVTHLPEVAGLPVRSVDAAFIGPVAPGPVHVRATVLRQGRNLTHCAAQLMAQPGGPALTTVHVVLGRLRESDVSVSEQAPGMVPIEDCTPMPYIEGLTPDFTQNFDFRFATGFPYTGSGEASVTGWCRHRTPERGAAAMVGLVDAWPGTILPMLTAPAPASTVRWSVQFPTDEDIRGDDWFWYSSVCPTAAGGYSTMTAQLWLRGRLVSWSEQLLAIFDRR